MTHTAQKNFSRQTFLLFLFTLLFPLPSLSADDDHALKIGSAIFAAASFATYGCYRWYKSHGVNKATSRIHAIKKNKINVEKAYMRLLTLTQTNIMTEDILQQMVLELPRNSDFNQFLSELDKEIERIHDSISYIATHIDHWQFDSYYQAVYHAASTLKSALKHIHPQLLHLQKQLQVHKSYLELALLVEKLQKKYQNELQLLSTANGNSNETLYTVIQNKHFDPRDGYPLVLYAEHIGPDIQNLEIALDHLSRANDYPQLLDRASFLLACLQHCKNYIALHPDYQRQRSEYAQFMQNEKLVKARQKEVQEIARKNQLEAQRLQEERRKNALLEQKIEKILRQTREYERLQRYIPHIERLINDIHLTIKEEKREISYVAQRLIKMQGMSPECYEFRQYAQELLHHEKKLQKLDATLDSLFNKLNKTY